MLLIDLHGIDTNPLMCDVTSIVCGITSTVYANISAICCTFGVLSDITMYSMWYWKCQLQDEQWGTISTQRSS